MGAFSAMSSRKRHGDLPEQKSVQDDMKVAADAIGTPAADEYREHIATATPIADKEKQ